MSTQPAVITTADVDVASSVPMYAQVRDALLRQITSGGLRVGDPLPTELSLCESLGLSRGTVRKAYQELVDSGRVVRRAGRGTFVAEPPVRRTMDQLLDFSSEMRAQGMVPSSRTLEFRRVTPGDVGFPSAIASGDAWRVRRLRLADGIPRALELVHVPCALVTELYEEDVIGALYPRVTELSGCVPTEADETYEAVALGAEDAGLLQVDPGSPAFRIVRVTRDEAGSLFEHSVMLVPGGRSSYHVTLRAGSTDGMEFV